MTEYLATIAIPLLSGLAAVYLLLPRPRPISRTLGSACAGIALVSAGWLLIQPGRFEPETVLFHAFAGLAILSGGLLIVQRNPVHAALSFALVVLSTCGLFLLQAAPFLMAATIIVYAGAIVVTFLFVIMLAHQAGLSDADARSREPLLSVIAGFVLLGAILYVLNRHFDPVQPGMLAAPTANESPRELPAENVAALGHTLFTNYLIPVELGGTLLLIATVGAIVIAGRRSERLR